MKMTRKCGQNKFPVISVVIPVYEEEKDMLREALRSIAKQSIPNVEIVVVDDASKINYKAIVEKANVNTQFIHHNKNKGAAAARNTGIQKSTGDYVAFLDADDTWDATKLEKQLAVFWEHSDQLAIVYTGFTQYELDGTEWERYPEASGDIYIEELERDRIYPTSTVMVRRDVLEEVGGFDTDLPSRQDYDLWIRITEHYQVDYVDEILVDKREQPDSISKNFNSRIKGDLAVFEKVRKRASEFDLFTRSRIYSYHHHVIGRDYESNGDRQEALKHLSFAILHYPFRPISYAMFVIALLRIDRNGTLLTFAKQFIR